MKFRRIAFITLALLSCIAAIMVCWLMFRLEYLRDSVNCAARIGTADGCRAGSTRPALWLLVVIGLIGGSIVLSFGLLAWQEHLIIHRKQLQNLQHRIFDALTMILHTGPPPPDDE